MFDVREKPKMVERALLVRVVFSSEELEKAPYLLLELEELVTTLGVGVVDSIAVKVRKPQAKFLVGTGKAEEVIELAKAQECDIIIFDQSISPAQQRNWEKDSDISVIDRQEIILDIFSRRARTREARLQVELARMEYNLPRLQRAWTHLSRQRGGGAIQRGDGESQLELDQRMVRKRISALKLELDKVVVHREVQRKRRMKLPIPTCSIVGYTNAGKSSLLNHLTESEVLVEDKLFATLDPTSRRLEMPSGKLLIVTDTVGFVRNLPHKLINAFKATLEEAILANFLIHVLDVSSPEVEEHYNTTLEVLKELGADEIHRITVFNKIDLCEDRAYLGELKAQYKDALFVSSLTGEGNEGLLKTIDALLVNELIDVELLIPHDQYQYVSRLHDGGIISTQKHTDEGLILIGKFSPVISDIVKKFRI